MSLPPPLPLAEAQARLLAQVESLPAESIGAERAIGRYIATPLRAARTQPAADLSAMDGYAMRADDVTGPWRVVGESAAGHPFGGELAPGETIRISTGALMPAGEGVVLLQENAARDGETLALNGQGEPIARHIRRAGFDFRSGDEVLGAGIRIGPAQLALALAAGHAELTVHTLPSLAVLDSGDELAADPAACAAHQIPASNGAMLSAMAAPFAASIMRLGTVPDRLDAMLEALDKAAGMDVIVTSGGASVGDHDLVRPALEQWGAQIDF
ncbi:MAG: molybdopterin molybdotransferase MoeA, partial [Croceibacterium sp.]